MLCLLTVLPPDRVGVTRKLSIGDTLKHDEHRGWFIDLTKERQHKTAKFYGPAMTALPKIVSDSIDVLLDLRKGNGMEFDEADAVQN